VTIVPVFLGVGVGVGAKELSVFLSVGIGAEELSMCGALERITTGTGCTIEEAVEADGTTDKSVGAAIVGAFGTEVTITGTVGMARDDSGVEITVDGNGAIGDDSDSDTTGQTVV